MFHNRGSHSWKNQRQPFTPLFCFRRRNWTCPEPRARPCPKSVVHFTSMNCSHKIGMGRADFVLYTSPSHASTPCSHCRYKITSALSCLRTTLNPKHIGKAAMATMVATKPKWCRKFCYAKKTRHEMSHNKSLF